MLLSTDWFLPFWSEIGICVDDAKKADIHEGCRAIVRRFMGDRGNYFQIDFTDKRRQETESLLIDLLGRRDLAEQRFRREAELKEQSQRTAALFDRMVEGLIVVDAAGRIRIDRKG